MLYHRKQDHIYLLLNGIFNIKGFLKMEFKFNPAQINYLMDLDPDEGPEIVNTLVNSFLTQTPTHFIAVQQGIESKDENTISRIFHNLKSSSGNIGLVSFSKLAGETENLIIQNSGKVDYSLIEKNLVELKSHFDLAIKELTPYLTGKS